MSARPPCPGCAYTGGKFRRCDACGCCTDCFFNYELAPRQGARRCTTAEGECYCGLLEADTVRPGEARAGAAQ